MSFINIAGQPSRTHVNISSPVPHRYIEYIFPDNCHEILGFIMQSYKYIYGNRLGLNVNQ